MKMSEELMEAINRDIYQRYGMSYEQFSKLDHDEQQQIICKHQIKANRGNDRIMIGSGEHAAFVDKSDLGITPDEYRERQEDRINGIIGEEKGVRKALSLFSGKNRGNR